MRAGRTGRVLRRAGRVPAGHHDLRRDDKLLYRHKDHLRYDGTLYVGKNIPSLHP